MFKMDITRDARASRGRRQHKFTAYRGPALKCFAFVNRLIHATKYVAAD